jgi:hypothetical protein
MAKVEFYDIKPNTPIASLRRDFEGEELNMQFDVDLVSALNQYVEQQQNPRHHPFARTPRTLLDASQLWPNEVRSIGVWARITSAVCVVADPLIELGIVGG